MAVFKFTENTPEVYSNESRDFQLICRIYDCITNGLKFDIDSIIYTTNTSKCNSKLIELLKTKIGFFTDKEFLDTQLRSVLAGFLETVKYKGTKQALEYALLLYLKALNLYSTIKVNIVKKVYVNNKIDHNQSYLIQLGIQAQYQNTALLEEILKYILPTGFKYEIMFYVEPESAIINKFKLNQKPTVLFIKDIINSRIREAPYVYTGKYESALIDSAIANNRDYYLPEEFRKFSNIIGAIDTIELINADELIDIKPLKSTELDNELYDVLDIDNNILQVVSTELNANISKYSVNDIDEFIGNILNK